MAAHSSACWRTRRNQPRSRGASRNAHRDLMGSTLCRTILEQRPQAPQRRGLVRVAPASVERGVEVRVRRAHGLEREGERLLQHGQPPAGTQRRIGERRRGARRAVDERHALLGLERHDVLQVCERRAERDDLAGIAVPPGRHAGHRPVEHRRDRQRELGPHGRAAADEAGNAGGDDATDEALGERRAERRRNGRHAAGVGDARRGRQQRARAPMVRGGHAVQALALVGRDERVERSPPLGDALEGARVELDTFAVPGDPTIGAQVEVLRIAQRDRHPGTVRATTRARRGGAVSVLGRPVEPDVDQVHGIAARVVAAVRRVGPRRADLDRANRGRRRAELVPERACSGRPG